MFNSTRFTLKIRIPVLLAVFIPLLLTGCINAPKPSSLATATPYLAEPGDQLLNRFAPVFWIEENSTDHNRIGTVRATSDEEVFIDPDTAVIYAAQRPFTTPRGDYTNLIYRVHFQEIPGGLSPFYLGAGKNIGLLIVITLNAQHQPLLVTSVHTCGCYLAFIPTSYLTPPAFPQGWPPDRQTVFSEDLPARLSYPQAGAAPLRIQISIRPDTHRVMNVWLAPVDTIQTNTIPMHLKPLADLNNLPISKQHTTSMFVTSGARKGYVKGSFKTRERLFMSWWALDWHIGQDKVLGKDKQDGTTFYTSLKPWARDASDMRDFSKFLAYWGWGL